MHPNERTADLIRTSRMFPNAIAVVLIATFAGWVMSEVWPSGGKEAVGTAFIVAAIAAYTGALALDERAVRKELGK